SAVRRLIGSEEDEDLLADLGDRLAPGMILPGLGKAEGEGAHGVRQARVGVHAASLPRGVNAIIGTCAAAWRGRSRLTVGGPRARPLRPPPRPRDGSGAPRR